MKYSYEQYTIGPFWGAYFGGGGGGAGGLILERAYLRREICVSKSIGLDL